MNLHQTHATNLLEYKPFVKQKLSLIQQKFFTNKSQYTILIRVNVSNIGTNLILFFQKILRVDLEVIET